MPICHERKIFFSWLLVPLLIVLSVAGSAADKPTAEPQKAVLALYGSRPDLPANVMVDDIIRSTLERELGSRLDFYEEFLDTARWPEPEAQALVRDLIRRKYEHRKFSAVIAVARAAVNFIRVHGDELFPGVPIVVYGDSNALSDWQPGRLITGALAKVDLGDTVDLILRLQPGTREILVISGASDSDRWRQAEVRRQLERFEKRLKFTYIDEGSMEDFLRTVARAPDGTVILFISMYQDSAGNKLLSHDVLARIARAARVPVYNQTATQVGLGIVGGVVFDPACLGRETAQATLRVLRGERLQDLPVQLSNCTAPMVDWRQLQRWRLDEKRLPAGTVVRFREVSPWQTYRRYIVGGISLMLLEALLIFGLLWQRARRHHAENETAVAYDRLRVAVEAGRFVGWDVDYRTGKNTWFGDLQGMFGIPAETISVSIGEFLHYVYPEDVDGVRKAIEDSQRNRTPYFAEFRVIPRNGESVRWVNARGRFYYANNGDLRRMMGMAVDVTERHQAEDLVRESEERFRLVANSAPVMIWTSGTDRLCNYVNQSWLDFTGRPWEAQLGNGWAESIHPQDVQTCLDTYIHFFDRHESFKMEYRVRRNDGEYRWVLDVGVPRFNKDGSFAGYIGSCLDITDRKLAEEALGSVSHKLIEAQEKERTRIARELHDDINQRIALATVELDQLKQSTPGLDDELRTRMNALGVRLQETGIEVQAISHRLHSSKLEILGVVAACRSFCREVAEQYKITVEFSSEAVPRVLPQDVSLCLFRVLQESLQNAVKYSGANTFRVQLRRTSDEVQLAVLDDGVGFDVNEAMRNHGLGLISMRERASLLKGTVVITSKPAGGTLVTLRVPIATEEGRSNGVSRSSSSGQAISGAA